MFSYSNTEYLSCCKSRFRRNVFFRKIILNFGRYSHKWHHQVSFLNSQRGVRWTVEPGTIIITYWMSFTAFTAYSFRSARFCKDVEWCSFVLRAPSVSCCIRGSRPSLAAGSPTDATTAAFHCGRLSANINVTEGLRLDGRKHSWAPERVQWERALNWFPSASCRWLRITGRYTIY